MTLQEFSEKTEMDLRGTLERFANMEPMLVKFLKKFAEDPSFQELSQAVADKDYPMMERSAHTLKGVAGNLGFQSLFHINQEIVDAVRAGDYSKIDDCFARDKEVYDNIIKCLTMLD
ncbi:Hpt domain-containing protein [Blautia schinkii]|nr:Hpt domain-containing protein [Blautia schinkii]